MTFTVGINQKKNIDAAVKKVSISPSLSLSLSVRWMYVTKYVSLTVFRELYDSSFPLRWDNN